VALGSRSLYSVRDGDAITVSCWVLPRVKAGKLHSVLGNGGDDQDRAGWGIFLQGNSFKMQATLGQGSGSLRRLESEVTKGWNHLAAIVDMNEGRVMLFHNGDIVGERQWGDLDPKVPASRPLTLGRKGSGKAAGHFAGDVDDLAIWRRALSADEIFTIYDHGKRLKASLVKLLPPVEGATDKADVKG
jgi:hypothetical protein